MSTRVRDRRDSKAKRYKEDFLEAGMMACPLIFCLERDKCSYSLEPGGRRVLNWVNDTMGS